jgi:hypothetical protein
MDFDKKNPDEKGAIGDDRDCFAQNYIGEPKGELAGNRGWLSNGRGRWAGPILAAIDR